MTDGLTTVCFSNPEFKIRPKVGEVWRANYFSLHKPVFVIRQVGSEIVQYKEIYTDGSDSSFGADMLVPIAEFVKSHDLIGHRVGWFNKRIQLI